MDIFVSNLIKFERFSSNNLPIKILYLSNKDTIKNIKLNSKDILSILFFIESFFDKQ